jgi:hypothetical protein
MANEPSMRVSLIGETEFSLYLLIVLAILTAKLIEFGATRLFNFFF